MVAVFAADVLQENHAVAGQVDGLPLDLLVAEVIHPQAQRTAEGLQDLEDAAVEPHKGDRCLASVAFRAFFRRLCRSGVRGAASSSRQRPKASRAASPRRPVRVCAGYSTLNVSSAFRVSATWTFHFARLTLL